MYIYIYMYNVYTYSNDKSFLISLNCRSNVEVILCCVVVSFIFLAIRNNNYIGARGKFYCRDKRTFLDKVDFLTLWNEYKYKKRKVN